MFKAIGYLTLFLFLAYTALFLTHYLPYMAEDYALQGYNIFGKEINRPKNATRRLEHLNQLVQMPILGRFFLQEKVSQLTSMNKFNESLTWAKKALSDPFITRSFPIWYHKALAQCLLKQYSQCENSLTWASFYSSPQTEPYLEGMYKFLQQKSNVIQKKIEIEEDIMITLELEKKEPRSQLQQL